jgi:hypothetical protein
VRTRPRGRQERRFQGSRQVRLPYALGERACDVSQVLDSNVQFDNGRNVPRARMMLCLLWREQEAWHALPGKQETNLQSEEREHPYLVVQAFVQESGSST